MVIVIGCLCVLCRAAFQCSRELRCKEDIEMGILREPW